MGANQRPRSIWKLILKKISSHLRTWKGRILSIHERLCLIKFVQSNLPLYYMSLFKIPSKWQRKLSSSSKDFF
ncbi:hypothetical protein NC651_027645 [Populus alba x Populus x berolinensis]|nr:hypothetical protein NC651_027645 [Populus alba x Populus x berolinensis]